MGHFLRAFEDKSISSHRKLCCFANCFLSSWLRLYFIWCILQVSTAAVGVIVVVAWISDGMARDGEGIEVVAVGCKMEISLRATRPTITNMITEVDVDWYPHAGVCGLNTFQIEWSGRYEGGRLHGRFKDEIRYVFFFLSLILPESLLKKMQPVLLSVETVLLNILSAIYWASKVLKRLPARKYFVFRL